MPDSHKGADKVSLAGACGAAKHHVKTEGTEGREGLVMVLFPQKWWEKIVIILGKDGGGTLVYRASGWSLSMDLVRDNSSQTGRRTRRIHLVDGPLEGVLKGCGH